MEQCHGKGTVTTVDAAIANNNTVHTAIAAVKQEPSTTTVASDHGAEAVASKPMTQITEKIVLSCELRSFNLVSMKKRVKTSSTQ